MTTKIETLRPGYLVSIKTSLKGNVDYKKTTIEADHVVDDVGRQEIWETKRTVKHAAEHDLAVETSGRARYAVTRYCAKSGFGLICPKADFEALQDGIREARELTAEFNRAAQVERLVFNVLTGEIKENDREAIKAIRGEIAELIADLQAAINNLDTKAISAIAVKATSVSKVLTPEASEPLKEAIKAARSIRDSIKKAGEVASVAIDEERLKVLERSRVAFIDLDDDAAPVEAVDEVDARVIDLEPEAVQDEQAATPTRQIELGSVELVD